MHYAIQVDQFQTNYLHATARKKALKHRFLYVETGLTLFKLGKFEYVVSPHQGIWIPFNCLHALTFLPGTRSIHIDFSVRLTTRFPMHAGYVTLSPLCLTLLERLKICSRDKVVFPHLVGVMKAEALDFHPTLPDPQSADQILQWHPDQTEPSTGMSQEMHLALLIREAEKRAQSGVKPAMIAAQLFQGQLEQYQQLRQIVLGKSSCQ